MKEEFEPEVIRERMREEQRELLANLNTCVSKTNAENAFISFALLLLSRWVSERPEKGSSPQPALIELAAFHLYPYFGNTPDRNASFIASLAAVLEKLKENRTLELVVSRDRVAEPKLAEIAAHVSFYLEDVRGTGYISQIREQIEFVHGPFEDRYVERVGIGPKRAVELLYAIQQQLNDNFNASRRAMSDSISLQEEAVLRGLDVSPEERDVKLEAAMDVRFVKAISDVLADRFPVGIEQLQKLSDPPTAHEWEALIRLIGLTAEARTTMKQIIDVKSRPLYVLPNNHLFIVNLSSAMDELFFAYEREAKRDQTFFSGKYHRNQKAWMEGRVVELLKRIFPTHLVFVGLEYPNPEKPGDNAEMDAAVQWGPFLILIEAKGKQFRLLEALTDLGRLRTDLKSNVQDAFEQANRATRFVNRNSIAVFTERNTGRQLRVTHAKLRRVFKVCVTLQHLADFATQLANLKVLNLFPKGDYPFSVSLADLDIITQFCESPDVFLHYIERRLELQRSGKNIMGDELDLFGTYLDSRLEPSSFWDRKTDDGDAFDMMWISGGSERFDAWHDAQLGVRNNAPKIQLALPPQVKELLTELRHRDDDGARWIAFALLSLSRNGIERLAHLMSQIKEQELQPGNLRSAVFVDESLVGVITIGRNVGTAHLRGTLHARLIVEKYRRKLDNAFGFTIELNDPFKAFDSALWAEGKWEHDPGIEDIIHKMPPLNVAPGRKLPNPDADCLCGSGKKFKNCCLPFFKIK